MKDPIVEEVRKAQEKHANEFNHDLSAICTDLKRIEQECGRRLVSLMDAEITTMTGIGRRIVHAEGEAQQAAVIG